MSATATARYRSPPTRKWWTLPQLGFADTGLTPGATYSYRIVVQRSGRHHASTAARVSVTMPTTFAATTAYATRFATDGARLYWPLNETSGTTVATEPRVERPSVGVTDGRADTGVTWGHAGRHPR